MHLHGLIAPAERSSHGVSTARGGMQSGGRPTGAVVVDEVCVVDLCKPNEHHACIVRYAHPRHNTELGGEGFWKVEGTQSHMHICKCHGRHLMGQPPRALMLSYVSMNSLALALALFGNTTAIDATSILRRTSERGPHTAGMAGK